jgi:hypothetical protein
MVSRVWSGTVSTANSTLNCLIFFWKNGVLRREDSKVLKTLKNGPSLNYRCLPDTSSVKRIIHILHI